MSALGHGATGLFGRVTQIDDTSTAHVANVAGAVHGAVSTATINMIMRRDASGRVNVVAPAGSDSSTLVPTTAWVQAEIAGAGTVTQVSSGTGLTGGPITGTGTLSLANTTVTPGSYTLSNITVDAQGRLTAASSGASAVTSVIGTAPIVSTGTSVRTISIPAATASVNGYMSSADKSLLDNAGQSSAINTLMKRQGAGRAEIADPITGEDIMNYQYWDANRVKDVSDLTGITITTGAPTGGSNGDIHFQY